VAALGRLVEQPRVWFDRLSAEAALLARLDQGRPTAETVRALASLGTSAAQRRLADLASDALAPSDQRQQALAAFSTSIGRHGLLLTTAEIQRQYQRYNASEDGPAEDQRILSGLLDALEAPRAAAPAVRL
jgi:hypothetical protein